MRGGGIWPLLPTRLDPSAGAGAAAPSFKKKNYMGREAAHGGGGGGSAGAGGSGQGGLVSWVLMLIRSDHVLFLFFSRVRVYYY